MSSARRKEFAKTVDCPSTEEVLEAQLTKHLLGDSHPTNSHLKACEFCAAEAHMLSRHHPSEPSYAPPEMPGHLRLLAESLLGGRGTYLERG
jgi:hypothetical protein